MEAEKSHNLPPANWRPRRAVVSIVSGQIKGLRTRAVDGIHPDPNQRPENQEHQSLRTGHRCPSSTKERLLAFPLLFCSIQAHNGGDDAYWHWWGAASSLRLHIQKPISSWDTLTDTPGNVLPAIWASLCPGKLIHKINHHKETLWSCSLRPLMPQSGSKSLCFAVPITANLPHILFKNKIALCLLAPLS